MGNYQQDGASCCCSCWSSVVDPYGKPVSARLSAAGGGRQRVEFEPVDVGPHTVDVRYAAQSVHGSPYTAHVYDPGRVRLVDAPSSGVLGNDVHFTGQYQDNLKANLLSTGIDPTTWEDLAGKRSK